MVGSMSAKVKRAAVMRWEEKVMCRNRNEKIHEYALGRGGRSGIISRCRVVALV